jgi:hypothetical protein
MIKVEKERDRVFITITSQLDREDVYQLVSDLNQWLEDTVQKPKFHNKAHEEAYEQAQSKLKLEKDLKRYFVDVFDSEYIQKMATVYELDPINKEIITKTKKLKDERRK